MHITLRPGEKFYLNGAVVRADRKVSLELMNDAIFLLEAHVMRVDKATSPLRQLYFIVQMMLMNPHDVRDAKRLFDENLVGMRATYHDGPVLETLSRTQDLVESARYFEALKGLREIFHRDDMLLGRTDLALAS